MRIIFLDVDGVLNSSRTCLTTPMAGKTWREIMVEGIDPIAMKMVNRLAEDTDSQFVISSSHRSDFALPETEKVGEGFARTKYDQFRMCLYFESLGLNYKRIIGATPDITSKNRKRQDEVMKWLAETPHTVESFVILDDINDFPDLKDRFVHVDGNNGFSFYDFGLAEKILTGKDSKKPRIILPPK